MGHETLSADALREIMHYDMATGVFTRNKKTGRKGRVGAVIGYVDPTGRTYLSVFGKKYFAHRIAWMYVTGEMPPADMTIDHINGDPSDNRWENLRIATRSQNQGNRRTNSNNASGVKGVEWHPESGKWRAKIRCSGRNKHIGLFECKDEAARAYMAAAEQKFGEFACNGRRA